MTPVQAPEYIPPRERFQSNEQADLVYSQLVDLADVATPAAVRVGDRVYESQENDDGIFPAGLYESTVFTR